MFSQAAALRVCPLHPVRSGPVTVTVRSGQVFYSAEVEDHEGPAVSLRAGERKQTVERQHNTQAENEGHGAKTSNELDSDLT